MRGARASFVRPSLAPRSAACPSRPAPFPPCRILDNFRPITIWTADLALFYCLAPSLGEEWTRYSWMQVAGLFVLLYGTAVYNAPNPGSVKLRGEWFSLGLDYGSEYDRLEAEAAAAAEDEGFQGRMLEKRTMSSFRGELAANLR